VLLHKDIAAVLTYGMLDNLVEKPKSEQKEPRRSASPSEGVPEADAKLLAEFGKRYRELTQNKSKSEGKDAGTFQAWVQAQRGLWTFNVNAWSLPLDEQSKKDKDKEAPDAKPAEQAAKGDKPDAADKSEKPDKKKDKDKDAPEPSDDAKRLRWIDAKVEGARFVDWKPFQHPELGAVEIGGFKPYALIEPPESERAPIAAAHYDFFLFAAESLPRVRVVECKAKDLAGGLWQIDAVLQNDALLPFMSALGRRSQSVRGVRAELQLPAGAQILAGNVQSLIPDLGGSGGRKELRWLVRGAPPSSIELIVDSDHAGTVKQSPEVK
jgi:hypothetical protein